MKRSVILAVIILAAIFLGLIGLIVLHPKTKPHSVALTWQSPLPVVGVKVVGYNIYRSTTLSGPYVKIGSGITSPSYTDLLVNRGRTYFYVVTAVDQRGRESRYSTEARAAIP